MPENFSYICPNKTKAKKNKNFGTAMRTFLDF
jgi:hypothetical protein